MEFIQLINKNLPEDLTKKTQSVTLSFQRLLQEVSDREKGIGGPESNSNIIQRTIYPIESVNPKADAVIYSKYVK